MAGEGQQLQIKVRSGTDQTAQTRPFQVVEAKTKKRWDPSEEKLPLSWKINDPNHRIRSGRIRYVVLDDQGKSKEVLIQKLRKDQLKHGTEHALPESDQWDGTIRSGIADRIGEKVTAELSAILVVVEVWNTDQPAPAKRVRRPRGRTARPGEWVASRNASVEIDAIGEANWKRSFVIPHDMPPERRNGWVGLDIKVKNVRDKTPVRVRVSRINKIDDPTTDQDYWDEFMDDIPQPGLKGLRVRRGKVERANGRLPYVRFNNYQEHWKYPGNNFYCFSVAFGKHGEYMVASERNYKLDYPPKDKAKKKKKKKCLHLRFTVFIHCTSLRDDYKRCAEQLHKFLRKETNFFRPLMLKGRPRSVVDWYRRYRHQYIVAILGHGSATCLHKDHPKHKVGKGKKQKEEPLDMYHTGFWPDHYRCPTGVMNTKSGKAQLAWGLKYYKHPFGGCANSTRIASWMGLGRCRHTKRGKARRALYLISPPREPTNPAHQLLWGRAKNGVLKPLATRDENPRLLFYTGGCRQFLAKDLAERIVRNETKYFHGWVWSVWIIENTKFCLKFFRRWIKGTEADPAPVEYNERRLVRAYLDSAASSDVVSHPRLMDQAKKIHNLLSGSPPDEIQKLQE